MSGPIDLTWGWLKKADSDLATATQVVEGEGALRYSLLPRSAGDREVF